MRALTLALIPFATPLATAQLLLQIQTERPGPAIIAPDFNGDGVQDIWIGDSLGAATTGAPGRVEIFSGLDGSSLTSWAGLAGDDLYGTTLELIGDVNGDGVRDVAIGAPGATRVPNHLPYVQVRSGATGAVLALWQGPSRTSGYGTALAAVGDSNADGLAELAIVAAGTPGADRAFVEVVSGANGTPLWRSGTVRASEHAIAVARLADQDGDGIGEVVAGFSGPERVEVLSGANGHLLHTVTAPAGAGLGGLTGFGAAIATGSDFDGDGLEDVLVGAPYERVAPQTGGGYEGTLYDGCVYFLAGAHLAGTPQVLAQAQLGESGYGWNIAALGDFDGDLINDFVTGNIRTQIRCCHFYDGSARVSSGADGSYLHQTGTSTNGFFESAGDWNRDGHADYMVSGVPTGFPNTTFETLIVPGQYVGVYGDWTCGGTPAACDPSMFWTGEQSVTSTEAFGVHAWGIEAGVQGFLLLSAAAQSTPFGSGMLCVAAPFVRRQAAIRDFGYTPTCSKTLSYVFAPGELGQGLFAVGQVVHAQFVAKDSSGALGVSDSLSFTVYP